MTERRNWFKIDEEVVGQSGKFLSQSGKFSGAPRSLLQKVEERVNEVND